MATDDAGSQQMARLYCIIARKANKAVVFRRGPSKQVRLLSWDLDTDEIVGGQWLKGRIYERRCDLSADGSLLVYFAAKHSGPVQSWTAVSRPPWLTALAFFPKDDCWGGGGLFDKSGSLVLNHYGPDTIRAQKKKLVPESKHRRTVPRYLEKQDTRPWQADHQIAPDRSPKLMGINVRFSEKLNGSGEDDPIHEIRLKRDGWSFPISLLRKEKSNSGGRVWVEFEPAYLRRKSIPKSNLTLQVSLRGIGEKNGRWYLESAEILSRFGRELFSLGDVDWCDVSRDGQVLVSKNGCLYRIEIKTLNKNCEANWQEVADLNSMRFSEIRPTTEAKNWP